jgi:hypothetical protein
MRRLLVMGTDFSLNWQACFRSKKSILPAVRQSPNGMMIRFRGTQG